MTAILGISAFYHDSAAALIVDGDIVAAAQEERFTRKKHDACFPARAVAYCLREAGLIPDQLDYVVFYEKPLTKFERLLETYLAFAPSGWMSFRMALPVWLIWYFLRQNKKWWLLPILLVLVLLGALILMSTTAAAPFIYTIF